MPVKRLVIMMEAHKIIRGTAAWIENWLLESCSDRKTVYKIVPSWSIPLLFVMCIQVLD